MSWIRCSPQNKWINFPALGTQDWATDIYEKPQVNVSSPPSSIFFSVLPYIKSLQIESVRSSNTKEILNRIPVVNFTVFLPHKRWRRLPIQKEQVVHVLQLSKICKHSSCTTLITIVCHSTLWDMHLKRLKVLNLLVKRPLNEFLVLMLPSIPLFVGKNPLLYSVIVLIASVTKANNQYSLSQYLLWFSPLPVPWPFMNAQASNCYPCFPLSSLHFRLQCIKHLSSNAIHQVVFL